jgi:hypothetical protein
LARRDDQVCCASVRSSPHTLNLPNVSTRPDPDASRSLVARAGGRRTWAGSRSGANDRGVFCARLRERTPAAGRGRGGHCPAARVRLLARIRRALRYGGLHATRRRGSPRAGTRPGGLEPRSGITCVCCATDDRRGVSDGPRASGALGRSTVRFDPSCPSPRPRFKTFSRAKAPPGIWSAAFISTSPRTRKTKTRRSRSWRPTRRGCRRTQRRSTCLSARPCASTRARPTKRDCCRCSCRFSARPNSAPG